MSSRAEASHAILRAHELLNHGSRRSAAKASSFSTWYVIECACGWSTPLCQTETRARELFEAHRGS